MADVLIAGAGPAGATLAILLGRAGLTVELYDARRFPREKPCGEGIMPAGVAVLERLGLRDAVGGRPLPTIRYHGFGLEAEAGFPTRAGRRFTALAQRRLTLDATLVAAARGTPGVRVFEGTPVEGAAVEGGRAVGFHVGGELRRGGLVVGADGIESPVRRSLGLEVTARGRRVGVRTHFRLAAGRPLPDRLEIFVGRGLELYAAPLPDGELLLAALCDRAALAGGARAALTRFIAAEPLLSSWLDGATPITEPAGRAPVTRRARAGFAPGAVLLGDAAEATDPLTAGGIAHALVTAELLAAFAPRALAEGDRWLARFDRARRRLLRPHAWLTRALVFLAARPTRAKPTLVAMRAAPAVMRTLLGVAGGIAFQPPQIAPRLASTATSSATALPPSSATDQNVTLSQRAGSP
jgi:2-polyprenyl-6-methoxyphenol hydroxylase-like FAD-dependent oxidoreductase